MCHQSSKSQMPILTCLDESFPLVFPPWTNKCIALTLYLFSLIQVVLNLQLLIQQPFEIVLMLKKWASGPIMALVIMVPHDQDLGAWHLWAQGYCNAVTQLFPSINALFRHLGHLEEQCQYWGQSRGPWPSAISASCHHSQSSILATGPNKTQWKDQAKPQDQIWHAPILYLLAPGGQKLAELKL